MLKLALVVCVVMVAGAIPQPPPPCTSPPVMTLQGQAVNRTEESITYFEIQYDAANKRKTMTVMETGWNPSRVDHKYIALNEKNVQYYINYKTNECKIGTPLPWYDIGAPTDGVFKDSFYFGGPREQFSFNEWTGTFPYNKPWIGAFTKEECYPIWYIIIGPNEQVTDSTNVYYFNTVEKVNFNDFVPPDVCNNATREMFSIPSHF